MIQKPATKENNVSEWFEGPSEEGYLCFVSGAPPPAAVLAEAMTRPDMARLTIHDLGRPFSDLRWLETIDSPVREVSIRFPAGKVEISALRHFSNLESLHLSVAVIGTVDFATWSAPLKHLSIIAGRHGHYRSIEALTELESLSVDLPGADISYVGMLPRLLALNLTAAPSVTTVPLQDSRLEHLALHQCRELDLTFLSRCKDSLSHLALASVKGITNGEALKDCLRLRELELDECGPALEVEDVQALMADGALKRVYVIGDRLPFDKTRMPLLATEKPNDVEVLMPPRFMPAGST